MFPVVILAALLGGVALLPRLKKSGAKGVMVSGEAEYFAPNQAPQLAKPLVPEVERLLVLLVLWGKDKRFPRRHKRYLSRELALEAFFLARRFCLMDTARAIVFDGPLPCDELLPGTRTPIPLAVVLWAKQGHL